MANKPTKIEQLDLFVMPLNDFDLRDQQDTMERPFFALSKTRKTSIEYVSPKGDLRVTISPNIEHGLATIWDADVLIWAAGAINRMNEHQLAELERTRTLFFHPSELLRATGRGTGGRDIKKLHAALERLQTTYIKTNIRTEDQDQSSVTAQGFSWIDGWGAVTTTRRSDGKKLTQGLQITLSTWFYRGVINQRLLLAIDPEYFRLTGGYERWLYRIARKHVGAKPEGQAFTLSTLHQKSGSAATKKEFKRSLLEIDKKKGSILGYRIKWEERDDPLITIYADLTHPYLQKLAATHQKTAITRKAAQALGFDPRYRQLDALREWLATNYPSLEFEDTRKRFIEYNQFKNGRPPDNMEAAFKAFAKKEVRRKISGIVPKAWK